MAVLVVLSGRLSGVDVPEFAALCVRFLFGVTFPELGGGEVCVLVVFASPGNRVLAARSGYEKVPCVGDAGVGGGGCGLKFVEVRESASKPSMGEPTAEPDAVDGCVDASVGVAASSSASSSHESATSLCIGFGFDGPLEFVEILSDCMALGMSRAADAMVRMLIGIYRMF